MDSEELDKEISVTDMPLEFKTESGKAVKILGEPVSPVLLVYNQSKILATMVMLEDKEKLIKSSIEALIKVGYMEDEIGNECQYLAIPMDMAYPIENKLGIIVDTDLRNYSNGFRYLLNDLNDTSSKQDALKFVFLSLINFLDAVHVLIECNNYYLKKWDGHQIYVNKDYGLVQFIVDGIDMDVIPDEEKSKIISENNDIVSAIILYSMTGYWPDRENNPLPQSLCLENEQKLLFSEDGVKCLDTDNIVLNSWERLPGLLKELFVKANTPSLIGSITLQEWKDCFKKLVDDFFVCPYCKKSTLSNAESCMVCGNSTDKTNWKTRWQINDGETEFQISFGRGMTVYACMINHTLPDIPLLKLMHNKQGNYLGIKNLSNYEWNVIKDENTFNVGLGKVCLLENGLQIDIEGTRFIFKNYEI